MHSKPSHVHDVVAVLAPLRRFELMVLMLSGVDRSVSQLAAAVGLSQSCTTRHLQALERAGLVKRIRDGKRVVFKPAPRDAAADAVLAAVSGKVPAAPVHAPREGAARSERESGNNSPPSPRSPEPAWRRSEMEDYLL